MELIFSLLCPDQCWDSGNYYSNYRGIIAAKALADGNAKAGLGHREPMWLRLWPRCLTVLLRLWWAGAYHRYCCHLCCRHCIHSSPNDSPGGEWMQTHKGGFIPASSWLWSKTPPSPQAESCRAFIQLTSQSELVFHDLVYIKPYLWNTLLVTITLSWPYLHRGKGYRDTLWLSKSYLQFVDVMYHTYCFVDIEPSLNVWDESHLVWVNDLSDIWLDSVG